MQIQNNLAAKNTSRNQGIARGNVNRSLEKLSTGYKINRAGDNAAGLALSENMRALIRGLDQAQKNVNDGIGLANTGDGALEEVHAMLERLKTLSIQAANGTYNSIARGNIEAERMELLDEIDRISESTNFDEIPLFGEIPEPEPKDYEPPTKESDITLQIGPSAPEKMDVSRYYMGSKALHLRDYKTSDGKEHKGIDFTSVDEANRSVDVIETAILAVSHVRASYGASTNHLDHTNMYLNITKENVQASESQIRDTNIAEEFTNFTSQNIILQASNSVMAHANSLPEMVVQLLQGM